MVQTFKFIKPLVSRIKADGSFLVQIIKLPSSLQAVGLVQNVHYFFELREKI